MKPALVLIDLQMDFLAAAGLEPAAGQVLDRCARLLAGSRQRQIPILHIWTTVQRQADDRMPHWKAANTWRCVMGTPGHEPPASVRPVGDETIVHKHFFSGFGCPDFQTHLRALGCDTLVLAGVHLHGCVRATALDAYERGYTVWVAADAVASDDPLHAAITQRYLEQRAARFVSVSEILDRLDARADTAAASPSTGAFIHRSPRDRFRVLWEVQNEGREAVARETAAAQRAWRAWRIWDIRKRNEAIQQWAARLAAESESLANQIVEEVGKPIAMARAEMQFGIENLRLLGGLAEQSPEVAIGSGARFRYAPLGVVAIITPYNNPIAIPLGKIGPAILYGNAVVWKPAPAASMIARRMLNLGRETGWPDDLVTLCIGDHSTAQCLGEDPGIDGLSISGSSRAGYALQELCARRHVPFQGEFGGNNASIVWSDAPLAQVAVLVAEGAFGFAGQRCTANRRVIVATEQLDAFVEALCDATEKLGWGDPRNQKTVVGPLNSLAKRDDIRALLNRADADGRKLLIPHRQQRDYAQLIDGGAYYPPTIVVADDPAHEIVQEESFGPILVVQPAKDFGHAIELCNGVRQGLVASLFSESEERRKQFFHEVRAGVLKIGRATAAVAAGAPFGGWKSSGVGPAEHGPSDREFYCRAQTIQVD
jgi:acyl-CoA reductase-like NAD-dependent aldehyde dehydrogenase